MESTFESDSSDCFPDTRLANHPCIPVERRIRRAIAQVFRLEVVEFQPECDEVESLTF